MSDEPEERVPLEPSEAFFAVTAADVAADDWLAGAVETVWSDPARDPRDAFLCFFVEPGPDQRGGWWLRGAGRVALTRGGRPSVFHARGRTRTGIAKVANGLAYFIAWWDGERPVLIEVWEMRVQRRGGELSNRPLGELSWRPGDLTPRIRTQGLERLGRARREALEREIWALLEPQSPAGRRERLPDPSFLRDLDRAVERVIVRNDGRDVRVGDWLRAMEYTKDTYYRRLREWRLTPVQVAEWVRRCVQDYWQRGAPGDGWELPVRLSDLASRDFCD